MHNIHYGVKEEHLQNFFKMNQLKVVSLTMLKQGTAVCEFSELDEAKFAVEELSGFQFEGRPMQIHYDSKKPFNGGGGGNFNNERHHHDGPSRGRGRASAMRM
jgi:RNA recognition motif-containing protein